jgi:hypothetical protein
MLEFVLICYQLLSDFCGRCIVNVAISVTVINVVDYVDILIIFIIVVIVYTTFGFKTRHVRGKTTAYFKSEIFSVGRKCLINS